MAHDSRSQIKIGKAAFRSMATWHIQMLHAAGAQWRPVGSVEIGCLTSVLSREHVLRLTFSQGITAEGVINP